MSAGRSWAGTAQPMTIDDCVKLVTAFSSFQELKDTQPTYAPKFYGRPSTTDEANAQKRVVASFNAYAEREGRPVRAFIAKTTRAAA